MIKLKNILQPINEEEQKLLPTETGLTRTIWVDENQTHNKGGHSNRIKIQKTKNRYTNSYDTISVPINGDKEIDRKNSDIRSFEIRQIKKFINDNKIFLTQLDNQQISFEDFKKIMIKYKD